MGAIDDAAEAIRRGELVAFPTETVYGLGANALDPTAVARIFEAKDRPSFDPLIVHTSEVSEIEALVASFPDTARALADRFWPGPLTLVLEKRPVVPDIVTAGRPTVAVRIPRHPVARALLERAGVPVAAPSANRFGSVSPTCAEHVAEQLEGRVDLILDGGPCEVGVESTIVSLVAAPTLLRPGGVDVEAIEALIGVLRVLPPDAEPTAAPGRQSKHYATRTPLVLATDAAVEARTGLLTLRPPLDPTAYAAVEVLSPSGDLREAASHLFGAMRRLDALGLDLIVATPIEEVGLGRAIMDRLRRAAL